MYVPGRISFTGPCAALSAVGVEPALRTVGSKPAAWRASRPISIARISSVACLIDDLAALVCMTAMREDTNNIQAERAELLGQ